MTQIYSQKEWKFSNLTPNPSHYKVMMDIQLNCIIITQTPVMSFLNVCRETEQICNKTEKYTQSKTAAWQKS